MNRRGFLKAVAGFGTALSMYGPRALLAADVPPYINIRRGGEGGLLDVSTTSGRAWLSYLLRDVQANLLGIPHPNLVRLLCWEHAFFAGYGINAVFNATSGLRHPRTNARTEGAAKDSQHLPDPHGVFKAVDGHIPGVPVEYLGRLASYASQGGVGFYLSKGFIHQDVDRVRFWRK